MFDAESFEHVDFVFFRRFSDGRSSQVAAYVVDNSDERLDEQALAELHLQVWLHGVAPLLYVAWPTRVDVLACARGPDFWEDEASECRFKPSASIRVAAEIDAELKKRFSAFRLADGTFWDDPRNSTLADNDKAAHESLIQAVVEADEDLGGDKSPVLRRLLLLTVLIKYLEDRRVFPDGWFGRFHKGARNFFDVLRAEDPEKAERLLAFLERKFNGDVFRLPVSSRDKLTKTALRRFAKLVEARTLKRQRYLWRQFSFEHLPVEIISHLYQRFVQGGHGTVYTPPFLAALLLDHAMPYQRLSGKERVLDPACGSGVFLVGAFRRLINVWRSRHRWRRPDVKTLKSILRRNIFGVELEPDAVDLAAFSLALAVCDALTPDVIWRDLRLDRLRDENLVEADFFQLILDRNAGSETVLNNGFDVILGNPPFESKLTEPGRRVDRHTNKAHSQRGKLPDNNAAYLFLEQALETLRPDGSACLIQPSGLLYNRKAQSFGAYLWNRHRVDSILDFTSIRNLYSKDPKTVAVCAGAGSPGEDHAIRH
ncbi:MAG: N-6 DNA methylase, partial [Candidatus Nealsonbacteria bacterium]|nr:N-6 DNA methylase [Candidatus Nealsonbacteria bacterium]